MPEFTSYPVGTPSWVDHAAKDLDASNSFYGGLLGWEAEDQGEEMGHYTILRKDGKTVAGNMAVMMEGQPSAWTSYVSVDDADATTDLARKAGAAVFVEPMDVSDIGRMAVVADPTGAAIGIWQKLSSAPSWLTSPVHSSGASSIPATSQAPRPFTQKCSGGTPTIWIWVA
jgi:predicted enzyme related to lactoylglutathione lyase